MTATTANTSGLKDTDNSTDIDWELQNKLNKQWLKDNPQAEYLGWVSI